VAITSDPDLRLAGLANFLSGENIKFTAVLLDASTFPRPEEARAQREAEDKSRLPNPYVVLAENLHQMGAKAYIIRHGEDLEEGIRRVLGEAK
jgi:hypothetical protein